MWGCLWFFRHRLGLWIGASVQGGFNSCDGVVEAGYLTNQCGWVEPRGSCCDTFSPDAPSGPARQPAAVECFALRSSPRKFGLVRAVVVGHTCPEMQRHFFMPAPVQRPRFVPLRSAPGLGFPRPGADDLSQDSPLQGTGGGAARLSSGGAVVAPAGPVVPSGLHSNTRMASRGRLPLPPLLESVSGAWCADPGGGVAEV
mmetsp:Transcript_38842/g.93295  ORF Transcript_38842/g.93295 Transcript_38842/m.93295 type:complete len:200 (-) Transcript_38842:228-827(-)